MTNDKRISELDGLRGIAALMVVFYHLINRFNEKFEINDFFPDFFRFDYGHYGVQLFFMISGFVIFMSIKRGNELQSPLVFAKKRFIRLYPTFWISMIITYLFVLFIGPHELKVTIKDFIINFTMLPKLFNAQSVDGVYWTLTVEMFFYVVVLFLLLTKFINRYLFLCYLYLLIGFVLFFVLKIFTYYLHGVLFVMGINFFFLWKSEKKFEIKNNTPIFLGLLLFYLSGDSELFVVVSIIVLLFYLLIYGKLKILSSKVFIFFGSISYSLYLIHQNIGHSVQLLLINSGLKSYLLVFLIPLFLSILLSYLITYYLEMPMISYFNRRLKS